MLFNGALPRPLLMPERHFLFSSAKKGSKNAAAEPSPLNFGYVSLKGMNSSLRSSNSIPFLRFTAPKFLTLRRLGGENRVAKLSSFGIYQERFRVVDRPCSVGLKTSDAGVKKNFLFEGRPGRPDKLKFFSPQT